MIHERTSQIDASATMQAEGFAVVLVLLVTLILSLLGISFLLMAETENRIAESERLSIQAFYVAEAGTRTVQTWFNRPMSVDNLLNPTSTVVDLSLRMIDADGDPATSAVAADGTPGKEYYKQGVDLDADGQNDYFEKPYRGSLVDTLLGTEDGPDVRIDESASTASKTFLTNLTSALVGGFPSESKVLRARITRIDIYAPPYVQSGGSWIRYGVGTVKVVARIYRDLPDGAEEIMAERMVKIVLNEIPYSPSNGLGPLNSCDDLTWNGEFTIHWGVASAVKSGDAHNNHAKWKVSLPRVSSASESLDLLWGYDDDAKFAGYKAIIDGLRVDDPWARIRFGGAWVDAPNGNDQPFPFTWTLGDTLEDGELPYHPGPPGPHPYPVSWDGNHSNVLQNVSVSCWDYDYDFWKTLATSGIDGVHYYAWDSGTSFREDGVGPARTFREITDQQTGVLFFDTMDGLAPYDNDADGAFDNLTPLIKISGGVWGVRGMIYVNAESFQSTGVAGRPVTFNAPGEPFQDQDMDGVWDASEDWINIDYPTAIDGIFVVDSSDTLQDDGTSGGLAVRNSRGPSIAGEAVLWGILFNNGYYDATGNAVYYGSVITKQGIGEYHPSSGTPQHYWDDNLSSSWPPADWELPRVAVGRWATDM